MSSITFLILKIEERVITSLNKLSWRRVSFKSPNPHLPKLPTPSQELVEQCGMSAEELSDYLQLEKSTTKQIILGQREFSSEESANLRNLIKLIETRAEEIWSIVFDRTLPTDCSEMPIYEWPYASVKLKFIEHLNSKRQQQLRKAKELKENASRNAHTSNTG